MAAGHVRDVDPPAVEPGVEPAARDRGICAAQLGRAPVQLRQRLDAEPGRVAVRERLVEEEEVALASRRRTSRGRCRCGSASGRRRRASRARAPRAPARRAPRRRRAAGRRGRRASRRSGACCRPGRTASGRARSRRAPRRGRAAARSRAGRRRRARAASSRPRPVGSSSQPRAHRPGRRLGVDAAGREAVGEDLVDDRVEVPVRAGRGSVESTKSSASGTSCADDAEAVHPGVADRRRRRAASGSASTGCRPGRTRGTRSSVSVSSSRTACDARGSPSSM